MAEQPPAEGDLTDAELEALLALSAAAAPAPWISWIEGRDFEGGSHVITTPGEGKDPGGIELSGASHADQDLIAAARNAVDRLVREVRRRRG